jgi:O-antigen ligase
MTNVLPSSPLGWNVGSQRLPVVFLIERYNWVAAAITLATAFIAFFMRVHPLWAFAAAALLGARSCYCEARGPPWEFEALPFLVSLFVMAVESIKSRASTPKPGAVGKDKTSPAKHRQQASVINIIRAVLAEFATGCVLTATHFQKP